MQCRRTAASKKPRANASSSSAAPEVDAQTQGPVPETSAKPIKSSGPGRKRAPRKTKVVATAEGCSPSAGAPDQAQDGRLLQEDRPAQAGGDLAAAHSTAGKSKKPPGRRKPLVRVAPVPEGNEAKHQAGEPEPSTAGHSSASGLSKAESTSSRELLQLGEMAGKPFESSLFKANELSPITEEQCSQRGIVSHISSPADGMAGGATATRAGQSWAEPVQDAWCYLVSSPEHSMQASPQLAACLSPPRDFYPQSLENLDSCSKEVRLQSSGLAKVCAEPQHDVLPTNVIQWMHALALQLAKALFPITTYYGSSRSVAAMPAPCLRYLSQRTTTND